MVEDNVGLMLTLYHHEKHLCLLLDPFCSGISRDLFTGLSLKYGCKLLAVRYKQYSIMLWTPRWAFSIPHKKNRSLRGNRKRLSIAFCVLR